MLVIAACSFATRSEVVPGPLGWGRTGIVGAPGRGSGGTIVSFFVVPLRPETSKYVQPFCWNTRPTEPTGTPTFRAAAAHASAGDSLTAPASGWLPAELDETYATLPS